MNLSFHDKTVFITGATSGIGKASAVMFAKAGARLVLCARRIELLTEVSKDLSEQFGTEVFSFQCDVTKVDDVENGINLIPKTFQDIDVLINNAGLAAGRDTFQNSKLSDMEAMIDTNLKGVLYVTHKILPMMVKRNSGQIIFLGSLAGREPYANGTVYCATKFGIRAINAALKMDLLGTEIKVSTVDPGMVETEFSIVRFKGDTNKANEMYKGMTPLTAEDVADAIFYCATRPPHVNISEILLMPTAQSSTLQVSRKVE